MKVFSRLTKPAVYFNQANMKFLSLLLIAVISVIHSHAQPPQGGGRPGGGTFGGGNATGHFYGKIVDSKTSKGLNGATVQLVRSVQDSTSAARDIPVGTGFTEANGDFSFENIIIRGKLTLRVTNIGYTDVSMPVSLDPGSADKDLGNIKLDATQATLAGVVVTSSAKPFFEMGVDRKVFNVDKNIVTTGQTATEVMKQIPSLNVDVDGNVTLRNAAPTIFIDGRPTTLTLDQIPADIIDKVELVTNPSAKYDASGGNAGILNIVLKKNKKSGYNGNVRAGVDSRGRVNGGLDYSIRKNKFNYSLSANVNQRKSKYTNIIDRNNFISGTESQIRQYSKGTNPGTFAFFRGGVDYFADNRNTFSLAANYVHGEFNSFEDQTIDSSITGSLLTQSLRDANTKRQFNNFGSQLGYKHNFAKDGHDITADFNYNSSTNNNSGNYVTDYYTATGLPKYNPYLQKIDGGGYNRYTTIQTDYENPVNDKTKIEAGARAAIRSFLNNNDQFVSNDGTGQYIQLQNLSSKYKFQDHVYAAYFTYSLKAKKWNYQVGLRAESSNYQGTLLGDNSTSRKDSSFSIKYPVSLFPSAFVTYRIDDKQDFQANYSRRINRPNFWQILPFVDNTDPLNLSIGNPNLRPEFTNSFEVNYSDAYTKGANLLISAYYKHTANLITNYFYYDANPDKTINQADSVNFFTYVNAQSSNTYGLELTNRITIAKLWDMTANINFFNSEINGGSDLKGSVDQQQWSYFAKLNNNIRIVKGFSVQLSGDYTSKTILPASSGSARNSGGGGGFGGPSSSAQGYIYPRYSFDAALRKEWNFKGGNVLSATLAMNDFARTQLYRTYSEAQLATDKYFTQTSRRRRDPQVLRFTVNYRFGKFDASTNKRKNNRSDSSGDMVNPG